MIRKEQAKDARYFKPFQQQAKKATLKSKSVPRKKREQSKCLTTRFAVDIIKPLNTEAYRSGHNEAVLKTVWVKAHGGSNPSASAIRE